MDILKLSKQTGKTITEYLTTLLIKSISETMSYKDKRKPVIISVPVNLRNYFPSNTARNFFNVINIEYKFNGNNEDFDQILEEVWGSNYLYDFKIVDVNIRRIRNKIEDDPSKPKYIQTVWGYGYCFRKDEQ